MINFDLQHFSEIFVKELIVCEIAIQSILGRRLNISHIIAHKISPSNDSVCADNAYYDSLYIIKKIYLISKFENFSKTTRNPKYYEVFIYYKKY